MKRRANKLMALLLSGCMVFSAVPATVFADPLPDEPVLSSESDEGGAVTSGQEDTLPETETAIEDTIVNIAGLTADDTTSAESNTESNSETGTEQGAETDPEEETDDAVTVEDFFKNLEAYVDVENDSVYPFAVTEDEKALVSTNKAVNNAIAVFTLRVKADCTLAWRYMASSESNYDYMIVTKNGSDLNSSTKRDYSGNMAEYKLYSLNVKAGDVVTVGYKKDSSGNSFSDCLWLKDFMTLSRVSFTGAPSSATIKVTDTEGKEWPVTDGTCALPEGSYTYTASAFGYNDLSGSFTVADTDLSVDATMEKQGGYTVSFNVTGKVEGKSADLVVKYNGTVMDPQEDGSYVLAPATYTYEIASEGYKAVSGSFTVEDQNLTIDLALEEIPTMTEYLADVLNYATLENDATYPFAINASGDALENTNKGKSSSTSQFRLTFTKPVMLSFDYTVSSEQNYDKIKVLKNGSSVKEDSGVSSGSIDLELATGDVLTIQYSKDSSGDRNNDTATVSNFTAVARHTITFENAPSGAQILLKNAEGNPVTVTDGSAAVGSGTYSYEVSAFGFATLEGTIEVADEDVTVDAALTALEGKKLSFRITGLAEGVVPAITVSREDTVYEAEEDGSYNLVPATYTYKIKAEGYKTVKGTVSIEEEDVTLDVEMTEGVQWDGEKATAFASGNGTAEDPYVIATAEQLAYLSAEVDSENTFAGEYLVLAADLDMGDEVAFKPIGTTYAKSFKGSFDGQGHSIRNLLVQTDANYAGLFGYVDGAQISNLTVDGSISGKQYVAGIAGYTNGATTITNCMNLAAVTASGANAGGIAGRANGNSNGYTTITGCINKGNINNGANNFAGGIAGYTQYTVVNNSYNTGSVLSNRCGGIVGQEGINCSFENLYSIGTVTLASEGSYNYAGAIVGYMNNTASWKNCYYLTGEYASGDRTVSPGMIDKTPEGLKSAAVIAAMGGSFVADSLGQNNGYPVLAWQDPSALLLVAFDVNYADAVITVKDETGEVVVPQEDGTYLLISGKYTYTVERDECETISDSFTINGSGKTIQAYLNVRTYPLAVSVLPAEANVVICDADHNVMKEHADNSYMLPKGEYTYTASLFGYITEEGTVTVTGESDYLGIGLTLAPRRHVTVTVTDAATGETLDDAIVTISHASAGIQNAAADGTYSLPDEEYAYTVVCPGYINAKGSLIVNDEDVTLAVAMEEGSNVWTGEISENAPATETIDGKEVYLITSAEELAWAADTVNTGANNALNMKLMTNIVLNSSEAPTAHNWTGIGNYSQKFTGTIDGNGKTISGYYSTEGGLVGYMGEGGLVKNLTIDGTINNATVTGGFANQTYGAFENCISRVDINANYTAAVVVGGIAGRAYATASFTNCANAGDINCTASGSYSDVKIGGIAGDTYGDVTGCSNTGNISSSARGYNYIGGIIGSSNGSASNAGAQIVNCYNRGAVTATPSGTNAAYAGGIAGRHTMGAAPSLANCYNTGAVTASVGGSKVGAIAGDYLCNISNTYYLQDSAVAAVGSSRDGFTVEATPMTQAEMCQPSLVVALGTSAWGAVEGSYPVLLWQGGTPVSDSEDAEAVAAAKEALTFEQTMVTENCTLELPASVEGFDGSITWTSDNTDVITDAGLVTLPEEGTVYVTLTATITKGSASAEKTYVVTVKSQKAQTQEILESAAASLRAMSILTPASGVYENINDYIQDLLASKAMDTGIDAYAEIQASVANVGTRTYPATEGDFDGGIAEDGAITFFYTDPASMNFVIRNAIISDAAFTLSLNGESVEVTKNINLGWDSQRLAPYMEAALDEALAVFEPYKTEDGQFVLPEDVDLIQLPKTLEDHRYIHIQWESWSDIVNIGAEDPQSATTPMTIMQTEEDKEIWLNAYVTFTAAEDVAEYYGGAAVLTKQGVSLDTLRAQMQQELNDNYTAGKLKDSISGEVIDPDHVTGDIQLITPRNTGIQNYSDYRFTVTSSDEAAVKVNGYRANVYRPMPDEQAKEVTLTVTMAHRNKDLSVSKDITVKIDPLTTAELDAALALMDQVKAAYWQGINDNANVDADHVNTSLHAFQEADLDADGNLYFIYNVKDRTDKGIIPGDLADYSQVGGQEAYNKFRSSKPDVIAHENLLLTTPQYNTQVTVDGVLEHAVYAKYAKVITEGTWYDNYFSKLVNVPVSASMKVLGTDGEDPEQVTEIHATVRLTGVDMTGAVDTEVTAMSNQTIADVISMGLGENYTLTVSSAGYVQSLTGPEDFNEANASVDWWGQYIYADGAYDCVGALTQPATDGAIYAIISNESTTDPDSYWGYKYDVWLEDTVYEAVAGETIYPVVYQMNGNTATAWSGINVYCDGEVIATTDAAGKAAIRFDEAGQYLITTGDSNHIFSYAYVNVEAAPSRDLVITEQPVNANGKIGDTVTYHVTAENAASYEWQYSKNGTKWYKSTLSTAATDTVSLKINSTTKGNLYRCKVTGVDGTVQYTEIAGLIILEPAVITQQPVGWDLADGKNASFGVEATGVESYQWQYSKDGSRWFKSSLTGADTAEISLTAALSNVENVYRCKLTGTDGAVIYTDTVGFIGMPKIKAQPVDVQYQAGQNAVFTVELENADHAELQWQYKPADKTSWYKSTASGATTESVTIKMNSSCRGKEYRLKITTPVGVIYSDAVGVAF
ncbi:MAG: hypothetical protein MJ117_02310 [Lachnospiraceae bacterium]|nr:hypothetical protein [Lachnospiraceae bacterium]